MKNGVPKEVKNHEYRVAITPIGVHELVAHGHEVFIQRDAGVGSQIPDEEYAGAGAKLVATAGEAWGTDGGIDVVLKVKEPVAEEYPRMREDLTLGAVPNTSTYALTNATLPYVVALADKVWQQACRDDRSLALGLNTHAGRLTNDPVGEAVGIDAATLDEVLG